MVEHYTFADTVQGLGLALHTTESLRAAGFRTRLNTHTLGHGFTVHTVAAERPQCPTGKERGCNLGRTSK